MINTVLRGEYIELSAKNKLINKSQKKRSHNNNGTIKQY